MVKVGHVVARASWVLVMAPRPIRKQQQGGYYFRTWNRGHNINSLEENSCQNHLPLCSPPM
jgi:hypothetical protein